MRGWLYANWGKVSLFTAAYAALPLVALSRRPDLLTALIWLQTPLYMLHQYEEHGNGAFQRYVNLKVFRTGREDRPLDAVTIFWINVPLIWVLYPAFALAATWAPRLGMWIVCTTLLNSLTHIVMGVVRRQYNPGLLMSCVANLPLSAVTLAVAGRLGLLDAATVIVSAGVAVVSHAVILAVARSRLQTVGRALTPS